MGFSLNTYQAKCRLVLTLSTAAIIVLPFLNVLRLDIPTLRFYFLNTVLWVDEFYLLFLILMLCLWIIVFFSMLYGRVWCGWVCPQTVISHLARWFEANAARLLGYHPKRSNQVKRAGYHLLTSIQLGALSLFIGFNLVAYFVDPYRMLSEVFSWSMHPLVVQFIIGIAVLVFLDAMFLRELFCTRACPYGMMQLLVTDSKTQIVNYDNDRKDDCLSCDACVRSCRMGIDIRESPYQTECVYCGDCVDACKRVLAKKQKPGLISFTWGETEVRNTWYEKIGLVDAKRWIVVGLTVVFGTGLIALVKARQPLSLSAFGDRSTLYRVESDNRIYNDYSIRIENRDMVDGAFRFECSVAGDDSADCRVHLENNPLSLRSRGEATFMMALSSNGAGLLPGPNRFELRATSVEDAAVRVGAEIAFFVPENPDSNGGL